MEHETIVKLWPMQATPYMVNSEMKISVLSIKFDLKITPPSGLFRVFNFVSIFYEKEFGKDGNS